MKKIYCLLIMLLLGSCSSIKMKQDSEFLYLYQIAFNKVHLNDSIVQSALSPAINDSLIIKVILDSTKSIDVRLAFINALAPNVIDSALCSKVEDLIYNNANKGKVKFVNLKNEDNINVNLGIYQPADLGCLAYLYALTNKGVPKYANKTITYFEYALSKLKESITLKAIYLQYKVQLYYEVLGAYSAYRYYHKKINEIKDYDLGFINKTYDIFESNFLRLKKEMKYDKFVLELAGKNYKLKNYKDTTNFLDQFYADIAFKVADKISKTDSLGISLLFSIFARDMATGYILKTMFTDTFNGEYYFLLTAYNYNMLDLFELALPNCAILMENEDPKVVGFAKEQYNYATKKINYYEVVKEEYGKETQIPKSKNVWKQKDCSSFEDNSGLSSLIVALKRGCYDAAIKMINNGAKVDLDADSVNSPFSYIYNKGDGIQRDQSRIRKVLIENAIIQFADRISFLPDSLKKNIIDNLKYQDEFWTLYELYNELKKADSLQKIKSLSSKPKEIKKEIQSQINLIKNDSENGWVLFNKATEYYETERYEDALDCINKTERVFLNYILRDSEGDKKLGFKIMLKDKLKFFKYKVLKAAGKQDEALLAYNEYYMNILKNVEYRIGLGKRLGFKEYSEVSLLIDFAYCNEKLLNYSTAEKYYYKAIKLENDNLMAWHKLAYLKYNEKKYDEALSLFDELIEIDTQDYMNSNFYKGICYKRMNKKQDAMLYFAKSVKIDSIRASMWQDCADHLLDLGYYEIAKNYYQTAIALDRTSYYHIDTARCWHNFGYSYSKSKNYDSAIDCYKKSIEFDGNYPYPYWGLASCYDELKDTLESDDYYETTIKLFKERIKKDPINIVSRENLAYILLEKEMFGDAFNVINKSLTIAYGVNEEIIFYILKFIAEEILNLDSTQTKFEIDCLIQDTDLDKRYNIGGMINWAKSININEQSKIYLMKILSIIQAN